MDKLITIDIDGVKYDFKCDYRDTRNGFAHDCTLYVNNEKAATTHCYYLNRTWERYTYQTVCMKALALVIDDHRDTLKEGFKALYGFKKMTAGRTKLFNEKMKKVKKYNNMLACMDTLDKNLY